MLEQGQGDSAALLRALPGHQGDGGHPLGGWSLDPGGPISETLDINYIHNQARRPDKTTIDVTGADYLRNQGVGTWEINLASFLYDLNTNTYAWGRRYFYQPLNSYVNGNAFQDACSILVNRYGGLNYPSSLASVANLYWLSGQRAVVSDQIDTYSAGPIMTNFAGFRFDPDIAKPPAKTGPSARSRARTTPIIFSVPRISSIPRRPRSGLPMCS